MTLSVKGIDPLLRLKEVMYCTGLSKTTIYRLISDGRFPRQLKLSQKVSAWKQSDIQAFIDGKYSNQEGV
ncbi:helix-turn-helix transcriptional regulator [Thiofilum flexile]|uniref:helix-turn-helix transcriptional regulator n=1 Tax=Thiofilum flexile TaxID=125627 RepID=UPI00036C06AB|nr:AlpA family transcriptional regulator [Thiofilum flexile]